MLVSLTVGKVDAGVAVLLTEDKRLIEFPSILLPPDITSGSIVDINVARNFDSEQDAAQRFASLQTEIFHTFGQASPSPPVLRCRNATQTSVVLEWDPMNLATAELRSLSLYRNGSKAGNIPRDKLSTKISGLAVDTEYTFHLVLRTSAGTYSSEKLAIKTQKMTDLTGITITPGIMPAQLRDSLAETVDRMKAKLIDTVRIDTTHFVCTEGRGQAWEKAVEMNVPVVVPDWVKGCEREGRIVGVRGYYLNADPKLRQVGTSIGSQGQGSTSQPSSLDRRESSGPGQREQPLRVAPQNLGPRIEHTPPTPERPNPQNQSQTRTGMSTVGTPGSPEPPTPPPKMEAFPNAPTEMHEAEDDDEDEDGNEDQHGGYAPPESSQPAGRGDDDDDDGDERDQESDGTEATKRPNGGQEESTRQELPIRKEKGDHEAEGEAEGNFDEVDL